MSKGAFLTPDAPELSDVRCRTIRVPNAPDWLMLVSGALSVLTHEWNYEAHGTATPAECAAYFSKALQEMVNTTGDCMIGVIISYATAEAPDHCLPCDGSIYDRVDYPILYAALADEFIVDADQLITPDLRSMFVLGAVDDDDIGEEGGAATHELTQDEMPSHGHYTTPHAHGILGLAMPDLFGAIPGASMQALPSTTGLSGVTVLETGGDAAHNNMPPYLTLGYAIIAE